MAVTAKKAPRFAAQLRKFVRSRHAIQRDLARKTGIAISSVNRLCNYGIGSEDKICAILDELGLKRRTIAGLLTDRRAELSVGKAREVWKGFRNAFLNEDEYLAEMCPFPFRRAYACTRLGIPIESVVALAKSCGISNIQHLREVDPWKFVDFVTAFEKKFGKDAKAIVLAKNCKEFPPVLLHDFKRQEDAANYLKLTNCKGRLLFGLPHLVIGDYRFSERGEIKAHKNTGGVEFLCSFEGVFELIYRGVVYRTKLAPGGSLFIYDARERHAVRLVEGKKGLLLMVRYDPKRREVKPGHSHEKDRSPRT